MERKSEKRRGKYITGQAISPIVKYRDDGENSRMVDNCWKYRQGNEAIASNERNERRQTNPSIDQNTSYYCPTTVQKPSRKHGISSSSRIKYVVPSINEEFYDIDGKNRTMRISRNQLLRQYANNNCANNIALVRKNRYVDDFDEAEEDVETIPYNGNENHGEEACEEIEKRREVPAEFNDKNYEEDEADDEIDEESDALDRQVDRMRAQRKIRMDSLPRSQRIPSAVVPSRYHRAGKIGLGKTSERCYHGAADHEIAEFPTEEENDEEPEVREPASFPSRKSALRSRHSEDNWISGRNSIERYSELPEKSLGSDNRQARRKRTSRPETETVMRSGIQHESVRNIKCNRCGGTSGHTPKTTSSRNAACRLQDSRYFVDETIGDETFEEPTNPIYQTKPRRSKETRSPIYEPDDKGQTIDEDDDDVEIGAIYKSCREKNSREKNARRTSVRASDRHEEKSTSKNNKRYWN